MSKKDKGILESLLQIMVHMNNSSDDDFLREVIDNLEEVLQ